MCFTQPISFIFGVSGLVLAACFYKKFPDKPKLAVGVAFFASMEFIQFVQYFYADKCEDFRNKFWTLIGFAHITLQPIFCALITAAFDKTPEDKIRSKLVLTLCGWGTVSLWCAYLFGNWTSETADVAKCIDVVTHDWLRSDKLCTLNGPTHLAWHVPLARPAYYMPNSFIHFFCMFVPYFLEFKFSMWLTGALSLLTGPLLAMWITPSVFEQASVWCYLSIFQILFVTGRLLIPKAWRYGSKALEKKENKTH